MIRTRRERAPDLLLLDAGNALYSGARNDLNQLSQGRITIEAMNLMGYDALAIGPYDLRLDLAVLSERLSEAQFAVVSANALVAGELIAEPYILMERSGRKIAIVGLTGSLQNPIPGVEVLDPVRAVQDALAEIGDAADLVLVLSNLGPNPEADLAQRVSGIDLIIGGGSGIPQREVSWQGSAALVRAGGLGEYLGITEIGGGGVKFQSVALGPDFVDDPELAALKRRFEEEYQPVSTVTPG